MAKGAQITKVVEHTIATVYAENRDWRAKQIQIEVNRRLREKHPNLSTKWPGLSAVQKYLTELRKKESEIPDDPEDRTWSVITLTEYAISPEALPVVLEIYVNNAQTLRDPLTIRQVKWIARLFHAIKDTEMLEFLSWIYAKNEEVSKLRGEVYLDIDTDLLVYSQMSEKPILYKLPGQDEPIKITLGKPMGFECWKRWPKAENADPPTVVPVGEPVLMIKTKEGTYERLHNQKGKE